MATSIKQLTWYDGIWHGETHYYPPPNVTGEWIESGYWSPPECELCASDVITYTNGEHERFCDDCIEKAHDA